jgi:hypothetical protein
MHDFNNNNLWKERSLSQLTKEIGVQPQAGTTKTKFKGFNFTGSRYQKNGRLN